MNAPIPTRSDSFGVGVVALVLAVGSVAFPIPAFVDLYSVPPGTACRPMGAAMVLFLGGLGIPLVAIVFGLLSLAYGRISRILGITAILLSCVPLPLYYFLFRWIIHSHHLILEP